MTRRSAGTTRRHATPEYDAHFHFTDLEPALLQRHAQFLGRIARTAGYCHKRCDVAWSVSLTLSLCVGRTASPAKTVEQIEVLFEGQNRVGSRNQVLNGCYVKCFFNSVKFILFGSFINFLTFYYKNVKCYRGT